MDEDFVYVVFVEVVAVIVCDVVVLAQFCALHQSSCWTLTCLQRTVLTSHTMWEYLNVIVIVMAVENESVRETSRVVVTVQRRRQRIKFMRK